MFLTETRVVANVGDGRIEDGKERAGEEMGNHHEKLGLKRISCTGHYTISNLAGRTPYPKANTTHMTSSNHNEASRTTDFSYWLISSILFSPSTLLSFLTTTLPSSQNTKLSYHSLSFHAMNMS